MFKVTEENGFGGKTLAVITVNQVMITMVKKKKDYPLSFWNVTALVDASYGTFMETIFEILWYCQPGSALVLFVNISYLILALLLFIIIIIIYYSD